MGLFKDDYFLLGSNNNEVNFYTKEGVFVSTINESIADWVLAIKVYITIYSSQVINTILLLSVLTMGRF